MPLQHSYKDAGSHGRGFTILDTKTDKLKTFVNEDSPRFILLNGTDGVKFIREGDFVRVVSPDPETAYATTVAAQDRTDWVESAFVEPEDEEEVAPRLKVGTSQTSEELLRDYCAYCDVDKDVVDEYVKAGLDIMESVG